GNWNARQRAADGEGNERGGEEDAELIQEATWGGGSNVAAALGDAIAKKSQGISSCFLAILAAWRSSSVVATRNERQDAEDAKKKDAYCPDSLALSLRSLRRCVHSIFLHERKGAEIAENPIKQHLGALGGLAFNFQSAGGIVIPPYALHRCQSVASVAIS